ncbi:putative Ig domain-containing protein, partial [Microbacterium sp. CPCC 204701]|uniref:putative Ig domain-containing protein n=1 Tax=Microbacterium sp. CPCC 204701 TaxID=2493084 RepID=UPI00197B45BC
LVSGPLPAGLALGADGVLSGTPAAGSGGSYPVVVRAANTAGETTTHPTLVVREAPAITSSDSASFLAGTPSTFTVTATGSPAPALTLTGVLPVGLAFTDQGDGTGTISGTASPLAAGSATVTLVAANAAGSVQQTLRVGVDSAPFFTGPLHAELVVGTPASFSVTATGRPVPSIAALGALPAGLSLTDEGDGTATLSGTPTAPGVTTVAVRAQSAVGAQEASLTITVRQAPAITSPDTAILVVGTAGSFTVTATGSPAPDVAVAAGALPAGVTLADNGDGTATISGTPAAGTGGDHVVTLSATVAGLLPAMQEFTLKVKQEPVFTSSATATFVAGTPGSFTIVTEAVPTAWLEIVGTLPPGLSFVDNGDGTATIAGTPAVDAVGTWSVTVNATNDLVDPPQTLTIAVAPAAAAGGGGADGGGSAAGSLPATGADAPL